jgi:hypothetical protein
MIWLANWRRNFVNETFLLRNPTFAENLQCLYNVSLIYSDLLWANVWKFRKYFAGSRSRKICFRPVNSSRSYIGHFYSQWDIIKRSWKIYFECFKTNAKIKKISQQSNMYISTICWTLWRSRSIAIGRNIYLESSTLYNYFVIVSCLRIS